MDIPTLTKPLPILEWPHPTLRRRSATVMSFDAPLKHRVEEMWCTMYDAPGIGLAAPQIGDQSRIFVMDCTPRYEAARRFVCINPQLTELSGEIDSTEGCLSFPGLSVIVPRAQRLKLRAQDLDGAWFEAELDGLEAICAQHEYDHLEGKSFLDLLSPLDQISALHAYIEELSRANHPNSAKILKLVEPMLNETLKRILT